MVGNVDAGKSTLLGVLTHGELDNGRGMARQRLFRHKHEMESGRTSSVGNDILGFDSKGDVVNKPDSHGKFSSHLLAKGIISIIKKLLSRVSYKMWLNASFPKHLQNA